MKTIYYITNIAPHYRRNIWTLLASDTKIDFHFAFGKSYTSSLIISIKFSFPPFRENNLHFLKNFSIRNVLFWQHGVINLLLKQKMDYAIFLGDMFVLSNWIGALICKAKGVSVVFWGHGFSGSESFIKRHFRILFNRLANQHLLYGHWSRNIMIKHGFESEKLKVVYNSLDYDESKQRRSLIINHTKEKIFTFFNNPYLPVLVFIGRLTSQKKIELLLRAVKLLNQTKIEYNLLIIGDGDQKNKLIKLCDEEKKKGYIHFYGPCYIEEKISLLIGFSDLCVSPGNIGLTAIHCMSYGTPVASHDNFSEQMPEFESIVPGKSGFFFRENDIESMVSNIQNWFSTNQNREQVRQECYEVIDKFYNPYYQLKIFQNIFS